MTNVLRLPIAEPGFDPAARFDADIWMPWPAHRRVKKAIALAKYRAIIGRGLTTRTLDRDSGEYITIDLKATHEEIAEGVKAYLASQRNPVRGAPGLWRDDGKYIPQLATWLNQGRWMDV
jgi:hypothetical protein